MAQDGLVRAGLRTTVASCDANNPPPLASNAYVSGVVLLAGTADFSPVLKLFGV